MSNIRNIRISVGCVYSKIRKELGMHLVTYMNWDTVPFLILVQDQGCLSEIEFTVTLFSTRGFSEAWFSYLSHKFYAFLPI